MRQTLFIFCSLLALTVCAQNKIDYDHANKKTLFQPLRTQLSKDIRYTLNTPKSFTYHRTPADIAQDIWNENTALLPINASYHAVKYDFMFYVIANGMADLNGAAPRWFRTEVADSNGIPRDVRGFVRDFSCQFPAVLQIRNRDGNVLDSIVLASPEERFTVVMHRDFLSEGGRPINPFATQKELGDAETLYRDALYRKTEQAIGRQIFNNRLWLTLNFLFNGYNTQKQTWGWGYVKPKGRSYDFADLDAAVLTYKAALDSMDKGAMPACRRMCAESKAVYLKMLGSGEERIDKGVQQVLYYNLSQTSLLSGEVEDAKKYYDLFMSSGAAVEGSRIASELRGRISIFTRYDALQKQIQHRDEELQAARRKPISYALK